jgi:hypothetical protein
LDGADEITTRRPEFAFGGSMQMRDVIFRLAPSEIVAIRSLKQVALST